MISGLQSEKAAVVVYRPYSPDFVVELCWWGTEVQFDTVQPVCPGIAVVWKKGVCIEQYGHQLRHWRDQNLFKAGGSGHFIAARDVADVFLCVCVCVWQRCYHSLILAE